MVSKLVATLGVAALGFGTPAAAMEQLTGGSFDATPVASISGTINGTGFVYPGTTTVDGWTFLTNAGVIDGVTATPWFGATPPQGFQGAQYAFVQNTGALAQMFTATHSGVLTVTWLEGARPTIGSSSGTQSYDLLLNTNSFGGYLTSPGQNFVGRSLSLGNVTAGNIYRLVFRGLDTSDQTVFIDSVSATITPGVPGVPEPANWLMLIAGFGLTGLVARRRRAMPRILAA